MPLKHWKRIDCHTITCELVSLRGTSVIGEKPALLFNAAIVESFGKLLSKRDAQICF